MRKRILLAQRILQRAGFKIIRQKGSHAIMMNDKNVRIVIPFIPGKTQTLINQSNNKRSWVKQRGFP